MPHHLDALQLCNRICGDSSFFSAKKKIPPRIQEMHAEIKKQNAEDEKKRICVQMMYLVMRDNY